MNRNNHNNEVASIITRYLTGTPIAVGYCKVNLPQAKDAEKCTNKSENYLDIEITLKHANRKIKKPLYYLETRRADSVLKWIDDFEYIAKLANMEESEQIEILQIVVNTDLYPEVKTVHDVNTIKDKILSEVLPRSQSQKYLELLISTKQENFKFINEYVQEITQLSKKYGATIKSGVKEQKSIEEQYIKLGISLPAKVYLKGTFKGDSKGIIDELIYLENTIIEEESKKYPKRGPSTRTTITTTFPKKYCSYHKTRSHDTKECRGVRKQGRNEEEDKSKINAIKEQPLRAKSLTLVGNILEQKINVLLDTGTDGNYISKDIVRNLSLRKYETNANVAIMPNGKEIKCNEQAEMRLNLEGLKSQTYLITAKILPVENNTLILGTNFMVEERAIINYAHGIINLDGVLIEMPEHSRTDFEPESELSKQCNYIHSIESKKEIGDDEKQMKQAQDRINSRVRKFAMESPEIGTIPGYKHEIKLLSDRVITLKPYPVPYSIRERVNEEIITMQKMGVIEPSKSPYCSPAFPILKRNGGIRICNNFKKLNEITEIDSHPCVNLRDLLGEITNSQYFSKIDLFKGYYQMEISTEDRHKTAFTILGNHYQYRRMPFGLNNAPKSFQRAMNQILSGLKHTKVYMDDLLIHTKTIQTHEDEVSKVLEILKRNNIKIGLEKSEFLRKNITYLGCIISAEGIQPVVDPSKIEKIKSPKNKKKLMKILGLLNWYRPHIRDLSRKISPLTEKLKKSNAKFTWTNEDEKNLIKLKEEVKHAKTLSFPKENVPYVLQCDASEEGIGGVLKQNKNIIGMFSKKLNDTERRYTTPEKEAYAIYVSLKYFRIYLFESKFTIQTDSRNALFDKDPVTSRVSRWKMLCNEFKYELEHIPGRNNTEADILSRINSIERKKPLRDLLRRTIQSELGTEPAELENNPVINRKKIICSLKLIHYWFGHPGVIKTFKACSEIFNIQGQKRIVDNIVKECQHCQLNKEFRANLGYVKGICSSQNPWEDLAVDILGPLFLSHDGNNSLQKIYVLVIQDRYSRYVKLKALDTITSKEVCCDYK